MFASPLLILIVTIHYGEPKTRVRQPARAELKCSVFHTTNQLHLQNLALYLKLTSLAPALAGFHN